MHNFFPSAQPLFQSFFIHHGAQRLSSSTAHLSPLLPAELELWSVSFHDMMTSLHEVASRFLCLSSCGVCIRLEEEPEYVRIFKSFIEALMLNQVMHASAVHFYVQLEVQRVLNEDQQEVDDELFERAQNDAYDCAQELEAFCERASLPGKVHDVSLYYEID